MFMIECLSKSQFNKSKWYFIIGIIGLSLLFIIGSINGKFWGTDFEVYYYAAHAFLEGNEVYGVAFGNSEVGFYKYSPVVLFLYIPASLLPFKVAVTINYFLLAIFGLLAIYTASIVDLKFLFGNKKPITVKLLLIVLLLSVTFLNRDLLLGNVNTLILLLTCFALLFTLGKNPIYAGLLYAIIITIKPYLLIVALPLLGNLRIRSLSFSAVFIILIALIPFAFSTWAVAYQLYVDWFSAMMEHSSYIVSPYTFDSMIKGFLFPNSSYNYSVFFIAFIVAYYLVFKFVNSIKGASFPRHATPKQLLVMETFTFLALIPNLVNTDTQQLMYTIPLLAFLIQYIRIRTSWYLLIIYIPLFFFFSIDQPDILGRTLANRFYQLGLSGISNFLIVGLSWYLFITEKKLFSTKVHFDVADLTLK